jgi:glycerophosphoryl diester phosphodiesterase
MKKIILIMTVYLVSCITELPTAPELKIDFRNIINRTITLSDSTKSRMNGIYEVIQGSEIFGEKVVGRWIGNRWCIYSNHDVVYSENAGGSLGDTILLSGYIRIVRSGSGSRMDLSILPADGGIELLTDTIPSKIIIRGRTSDNKPITLQKSKSLYSPAESFYILAHRGGGRNSERLGYSENSLEMIMHSQVLGATGVEIDVKRTRDNKLIVFHDDTFSPRTVKGTYLLGKVENFDLNQIKSFGRLIYGETIPTLSEALRFVTDSTKLSLVWLDLKDPSIVDETISIQSEALDYAMANGRDVQILLGIPDEDVLDAYRSSSLKDTKPIPILIELSAETVLSLKPTCKVWAPRWTNGIPYGDIERVQHEGIKVFVWTLDVRDFIEDFLFDSQVDGILSNYPSLVAGMYYSRE